MSDSKKDKKALAGSTEELGEGNCSDPAEERCRFGEMLGHIEGEIKEEEAKKEDGKEDEDKEKSSEAGLDDQVVLKSSGKIRKSIANIFNLPNILGEEILQMSSEPRIAQLRHHYLTLQEIPAKPMLSPMLACNKFSSVFGGHGYLPEESFVYPLSMIRYKVQITPKQDVDDLHFIKAGPRKHLYYDAKKVVAAIVTCGGLCPGLNVVIRELFFTLTRNYGCEKVYGIQYGYRGFYTYNWIELRAESVNLIHKHGGTLLGSSRGGFDLSKIMKKLKSKGVTQLYIIGGDGTLKGASAIETAVREERLPISVVGIPKTIDNDIQIVDASFGYQTAVDHAVQAINSAETEAFSAEFGVGLVKLMGRSAGHIALEASLSHRGVNVLLIPEIPFELYGPEGFLEFVFKSLLKNHHCVVVVAEGASEAVKDFKMDTLGKDASGNVKYPDIGLFLKDKIVSYCKEKSLEVTLKYIDPTYMIRTIPSNAHDTNFCSALAYDAVNGAMAGFSGFCVGMVNKKTAYIPLEMLTKGNKRVKPKSNTWQRLLAATGQPSFINNEEEQAYQIFQTLATQLQK